MRRPAFRVALATASSLMSLVAGAAWVVWWRRPRRLVKRHLARLGIRMLACRDTPPGGYVVLNPSEGVAGSLGLKTRLDITATGSAPGLTFDVVTSVPSANTVVSLAATPCTTVAQCLTGQACIDNAGMTAKECRWTLAGDLTTQTGSVVVDIGEGRQTLAVRIHDAAGNANDLATNLVAQPLVMVDLIPPAVSFPGPLYGNRPYTSRDGTIADQGTLAKTDDTLGVAISVAVGDNASLAGGTVTLRSYDAVSAGTLLETTTVTLTDGQTTAAFAAFPLHLGDNYLEAVLVDAAGNTTSTALPAPPKARTLYLADFYAPDLVLEVWAGRTGSPSAKQVGCGDVEGTPCLADYLDPAGNDGMAKLDAVGTDAFAGSPATGGTDLRFSLTAVGGVPEATTVWLESYLAPVASYASVFQSEHAEAGDVVAFASYDLRAGASGYALYPGDVRGVRVAAMDPWGNTSYSAPIFLRLNLSGLLFSVQRLNGVPAPVGPELVDGTFWGPAENLATPPSFSTNLRVTVTRIGGSAPTPTDADLTINGGAAQNLTLTGGTTADFMNVALVMSPNPADRAAAKQNTITVTANCNLTPNCGSRQYVGIIADVDPPSFQFDRCSLCGVNVPLATGTVCTTCSDVAWDGNSASNITGVGDPAIWNAARDQDSNPANGFSIISSGVPLIVKLKGLEPGEHVRLISDRLGVTGNDVLSAGCAGAACDGTATFGALSVPSLAAPSKVHKLALNITDRAGNTARVDPGRGNVEEAIYAKTDVLVPGAALATVCIGESTTPYTITNPTSDPTTYEDPSCAAACTASSACSRRGGKATLVWQAPYDDGTTGGRVASYEILVAARGIPYPQPYVGGTSTAISQCSDMNATDVTKAEQVITMAATAAPLGQETKAITGLFPHRSYCFAVLGVDDVGNRALLATSVRERGMPLVNYPQVVAFDPITPMDDQPASALYQETGATSFGFTVVDLGDLDEDGRGDFAVSRPNDGATVSLFLSSKSATTPDLVIEAPAGDQSSFGYSMAAGDFDHDGRRDLAVCAYGATSTGGSAPGASAGALYLYYGVAGSGIRRDANGGDIQLPSINPDVAVFGPANSYFCATVKFGDTNGSPGDDVVVSSVDSVFGFFGGSRARFPGSPPATSIIYADLVSPAGPGFANRPEFAIRSKTSGSLYFPWDLATPDVDGDGLAEVVVTDPLADHDGSSTCDGCGEIYVFKGGSQLIGDIGRPDQSPAQLLHTLRWVTGQANFGQSVLTVPHPRGSGDPADWLLVQAAGANRVLVFIGTAIGPSPGIVPGNYPAGGRAPADYGSLDSSAWDGTSAPYFGWSMAVVGELDGIAGPDLVVGQGNTVQPGRYGVSLFSYSSSSDSFVKRAILWGGPNFGAACGGVQGFSGANGGEIVVSSMGSASLYLFR